jgi:hypothetical protein
MFESILAALMGPQQVEEKKVEAPKQEPLPQGVEWCYSETNERCACDFRVANKSKVICGYGDSFREKEKK